uniref:Adhesion G protein-coupled receptor G2a n=1 Tax=Gasterosteus aculeatus aculeatus TaxID=481459 RepID=A0AAQ4R9M0_GASAC
IKLVVAGDTEILSAGSLVLAVQRFPLTASQFYVVQLRALSRSRSKRSGSALGSVFLPSSLTNGLSLEQQKEANRVQFNFYTKSALFQDASLDTKTLVSPVLAASVANLSISNLAENIQFTIRNIDPMRENYTASCVFWQITDGTGHWSSAGCSVVNATAEETTCSCNHLTSFAILLDLSRDTSIDPGQLKILTFITYIGCGISTIFLALTLLTYLSFDKLLRDIPAKILVQLCLSLFLLNLVFLLDGWLALFTAPGLCISTAFFLHYFLLTSFTWAGLEALHMYLSIVRVFTPYLSRYMLKFSLLGWGIPLLVVTVVISVDKDNYGLVTYGKYRNDTSNDLAVQYISYMRSIVGLIVLLGLTWGFSLFAWGPLYLPFVYLFTIFNSLQGFFVFIFHCAVKESVRRQWRTYLCCGKLRLAENSDWSRTATQINKKRGMSVATTSTYTANATPRSASVISVLTSGSGTFPSLTCISDFIPQTFITSRWRPADSVFMDSGISDGSNSDALLNEIHQRNPSL